MKKVLILLFICFVQLFLSFFLSYGHAMRFNEPFAWDQSNHLSLSKYEDSLFKQGKILEGLRLYKFYPPLAHVTYIPFMNWLGISRLSITVHTYMWLFLLCVGIVYLSFGFISGETQLLLFLTGLTLLTVNGIAAINVWEPMLEIPLTISIIIYYFYCYRVFQNKDYTISSMIGLCFLISFVLLIKGTGFPYLLVLLVYYWYQMIKKFKVKALGYFVLFLGLVIILNDWYRVNLNIQLQDAWFINVFTGIQVKHDPQGLGGVLRYLTEIWEIAGLFLPIFIYVWIARFIHFGRSKEKVASHVLVIWISLITIFVVLVLSPNKDERYIFTWVVLAMLMSILTNIHLVTKKLLVVMYIYIVGILVWKTATTTPLISNRTYIIDELPKISQKYNLKHLNIFFEDDSKLFNYSNIELMYLTTFNKPYTFLNSNSFDTLVNHRGTCNIYPDSSYVLVYANKISQNVFPNNHIPFVDYCTNFDVNKSCQLVDEIKPNGHEQLSIYECQLFSSRNKAI